MLSGQECFIYLFSSIYSPPFKNKSKPRTEKNKLSQTIAWLASTLNRSISCYPILFQVLLVPWEKRTEFCRFCCLNIGINYAHKSHLPGCLLMPSELSLPAGLVSLAHETSWFGSCRSSSVVKHFPLHFSHLLVPVWARDVDAARKEERLSKHSISGFTRSLLARMQGFQSAWKRGLLRFFPGAGLHKKANTVRCLRSLIIWIFQLCSGFFFPCLQIA